MDRYLNISFSDPVAVLHERRLPKMTTPVEYAALVEAFAPKTPR